MDNGRPQSNRESIGERSVGHAWCEAQRDNEQCCPGDWKPTLITILAWSLAVGVFNCSVHIFSFLSEPNIWSVHNLDFLSCFGLLWLLVVRESLLAFQSFTARNWSACYAESWEDNRGTRGSKGWGL